MPSHYRELIAWQKSMELVTHVYQITKEFPSDERFGLTSQIRRAAVSIPSNIAEGCARNSTGEFCQFLGIARGSLAELTTQLLIAQNVGFIASADETLGLVDEVGKILNGLLKSLRSNANH